MYSTKRFNSKTVDGNAYLCLGDPYKGGKQQLPDRWKGDKHMICEHYPEMSAFGGGGGYFRKLEYPPMKGEKGSYSSGDPYVENESPIKPGEKYEKRTTFAGKGNEVPFGSNDVSKRGEFTATIRTQQYRECLKKEQRMIEMHRNHDEEDKVMLKHRNEIALRPKKFLYDIGRSKVTEFDPKSHRDKHFIIGRKDTRDVGHYRLSSREWGDGAEKWKYTKPQFGPIAHVKNFFDKSHLDVSGF